MVLIILTEIYFLILMTIKIKNPKWQNLKAIIYPLNGCRKCRMKNTEIGNKTATINIKRTVYPQG